MAGNSTYSPTNGFTKWVDSRLPIIRFAYDTIIDYPTPKNLNYWWTMGAVLTAFLGIQIVTGIILAMHYTPHVDMAFNSVEFIRRDVNWGRIIQGSHAVGASFFFLAVYIHMFRGLFYGSYKAPREVLWLLGVIIFVLMMATAFMGYVLPWGQMSFWAATVITQIFSAIPIVGDPILEWLRGGFAVENAALNRFFSLHYLLPFMIAAVVGLHIWALHVPGNNNPTGIEAKTNQDTLAFHPYYTIKDTYVLLVFLIPYAWFVFFAPDILGHSDNYIPANPQVTPAHIVPEWYFLPYYAMLRAIDFNVVIPFTSVVLIDSKLGGVIVFFGSILILLFVPWLDRSPVRSGSYRPVFKWFFALFVVGFIILAYLGSQTPDGRTAGIPNTALAQALTAYYFIYFLIVLPLLPRFETPRELPPSISQSVLDKHASAEAGEAEATS